MNESPKTGAFSTIGTFLFGSLLHLDKSTQDDVTFWLQALAFIVSLVVGVLTICISIKKLKSRDERNN